MNDFARIDPRRDAEKSAVMHVSDPYEDEPLYHNGEPIEIDFLGVESRAGRKAAARMVKAMNRKQGKSVSEKDMSAEQLLELAGKNEAVQAQFYADLTTGWRNIHYLEDSRMDDPKAKAVEMEFSENNALKLFKTRAWIRAKADTFLGDKSQWKGKNETS
jgi:hypothetical protein